MAKTGRPRIQIDETQFKDLCNMLCTEAEIAAFFHCDTDTLWRWCKRTYKKPFTEVFAEFSANGKMSLRRKQFALAEKSAAMAIFLGKNYLGQTDQIENKVEFENDGFIDALKGQAQDTFKNAGDIVEE